MKAKHLVIYALLTCLFIVFFQSAEVSNASSPISGRFPISTISNAPTHAGELNPSVAYNSGFMNVYLVVWDQLNADSSASVVYGQFVDSGGTLNGVKCSISPLAGYNQYPDVAYNSTNDQFLVVYERAGGIYGQILTNTGGIVGTEIAIALAGGTTFQRPAVAYCSAANQYLVAYQAIQGVARSVEAQAVNANGSLAGSFLPITGLVLTVAPSEPDVAYDSAADNCLIVWQQYASVSATDHDIYGQAVGMTGGAHLTGSNFAIHNSTDDEVNPAVAALPEPAA